MRALTFYGDALMAMLFIHNGRSVRIDSKVTVRMRLHHNFYTWEQRLCFHARCEIVCPCARLCCKPHNVVVPDLPTHDETLMLLST